jgi:hypothetical protein
VLRASPSQFHAAGDYGCSKHNERRHELVARDSNVANTTYQPNGRATMENEILETLVSSGVQFPPQPPYWFTSIR